MEKRRLGLQVEALHVHHPPIPHRRQHGDAEGARPLAQQHADVEVVAGVDDGVQGDVAAEEVADVLLRQPLVEEGEVGERVRLADLPRGEHGLGQSQVLHPAAQPVEVAE